MGWCYCVRFNLCFYGYGRFCLFVSHQGLFKKSGEKRKILDGLINISIHSFRLLCFLSLILLFLLGVLYHLLVLGVLVNGFGGLGAVGYWVVLTTSGLFRGLLLSWVFFNGAKLFLLAATIAACIFDLGAECYCVLWSSFFLLYSRVNFGKVFFTFPSCLKRFFKIILGSLSSTTTTNLTSFSFPLVFVCSFSIYLSNLFILIPRSCINSRKME